MANFFEQFHDSPAPAAPGGTPNFFSQFHPEVSAPDDGGASFDERFRSSSPTHITVRPAALSDVVTDIPKEVSGAYTRAAQHLTGSSVSDLPGYDPRTRGELGPLEGLARTGKQMLGVPELLAALPAGLARSVIGHLMSQGEHWVGSIIAPDVAAKDDPQKMYDTAKGDVDTALAAAGTRSPIAVTAKPPVFSIPELKAGAKAGYEGPELTGLEVKPVAITDFASKTKSALDAAGLDENLAPKVHAILTKLESVPAGPSATVTGNNIKSLRQLLGNAASSADAQEQLAAKTALDALDKHIPTIPAKDVIAGDPKEAGAALDDANSIYSAAKHAETIDKKAIQAELRAAVANSGHNVANTVRARMADILIKPDLQRGFQPDELAFMEQIVRGTKTQNALRAAGNLMGGGGGLGAAVTGGIGAVATPGGVGGLIPVIGYGLKALSNHLALSDVGKLSEMIRSRPALESSMNKFNAGAGKFASAPNGKTYAAALIAARNFSSNLRSAGVDVSPADLLKVLQSPAPAQADDQENIPRPPGQ